VHTNAAGGSSCRADSAAGQSPRPAPDRPLDSSTQRSCMGPGTPHEAPWHSAATAAAHRDESKSRLLVRASASCGGRCETSPPRSPRARRVAEREPLERAPAEDTEDRTSGHDALAVGWSLALGAFLRRRRRCARTRCDSRAFASWTLSLRGKATLKRMASALLPVRDHLPRRGHRGKTRATSTPGRQFMFASPRSVCANASRESL